MEEEIIYIPYGLDEISQQELNTNLANNLQGFMQLYKWLSKPKNAEGFMRAYQDIMDHELSGASNDSGQWEINYNKGKIDLDSMSPLERLYYEHAAHYIQQLMNNTTKRKKEELKKKDKQAFDNNIFEVGLAKHIGKNKYGGQDYTKWQLGDWLNLDSEIENGIYGTEKRQAELAKYLDSYRNEISSKKDEFDFENSPYASYDEFSKRIDSAIAALKNPEFNLDDINALNALGINRENWLSTGENAPVNVSFADGTTKLMTRKEYNQLQAEQQQLKLDAENKAKADIAAKQKVNYWDGFKSYDFSKFHGRPLKSEESNIKYLSNLFNKENWTADEQSQIVLAFKLAELNGKLVPLSKEELSKLNPSRWKNRAKYLRKIDGINGGLYYDTYSGLYKKFYKNGQTSQTSFLNILDLNNSELKKKLSEDKYWNSPIKELDSYDYANIIGALADVASIVDVEPISAAVLAEIGTAARSYGRSKNTGFWENALYTTGDATIGALSAIPVVGDAALGWRLGATGLKYLGYAGLIFNAKNLPDAASAFSKWYNYTTEDGFSPVEAYKKLTRKEAEDLLNGILELAGIKGAAHGALSRKVTEPVRTNNQKVVDIDVKVKGNNTKIQVTPEEAKQIRSNLVGKLSKSNEKLRKQSSVLKYAKDNNIEVKDIELVSAPGHLPFTRKSGMTQRTISTEGLAKPEDFGLVWRNFARWQSNPIFNKNNSTERNGFLNKLFGGYKSKSSETSNIKSKKTSNNSEIPKTENVLGLEQVVLKNTPHSKNEIRKDWKNTIEKEQFTTNEIKSGDYTITNPKDSKYNVNFKVSEQDSEGFRTLVINGPNPTKLKFKTLRELLKKIANVMKSYRFTTNNASNKAGINHKEIGKILQDLKRKGWLKQGGTIDSNLDTKLNNFFKTL